MDEMSFRRNKIPPSKKIDPRRLIRPHGGLANRRIAGFPIFLISLDPPFPFSSRHEIRSWGIRKILAIPEVETNEQYAEPTLTTKSLRFGLPVVVEIIFMLADLRRIPQRICIALW
jgi:hypothetical protein